MPSAQTSQGHLRTRKIDYRKQLGVLRHGDVDLDELRPALQQPAAQGVEKDEQSELHLVAALQLNTSSTRAVIPTPHSSSSKEYDTLYTADYARPSKLVCWSALVEDVIGCDYNAGPEDQQWLTSQSLSIADFERMVFLLERVGDEKDVGAPPTLAEAREFAIEAPVCADPVFDLVYRYWRDRRYQTLRERLKPTLKLPEESHAPDADPYVCFRKRETKSLRKPRRGDALAHDKLLRLRDDLTRATAILDQIHARDTARLELVQIDRQIFEQRTSIRRKRAALGLAAHDIDASPERPRKPRRVHRDDSEQPKMATRIRIPIQKLRDAALADMDVSMFGDVSPVATSADERLRRMKLLDEKTGWLDTTDPGCWNPRIFEFGNKNHVSTRRRVGRGGRIIFDRHFNPKTRPTTQEASRWLHDTHQSDPDEYSVHFPTDHSVTGFRSFSIAPHEEQYRNLMNRPMHIGQIHPQPNPRGYRFPQSNLVLQIIRVPIQQPPNPSQSSSTTKKRAAQRNGSDARGGSANSKRKQEVLDPRSAAVKAMMQQAQRQAQHAHAQLMVAANSTSAQQHMGVPGTPGSQAARIQQLLLQQQMQQGQQQQMQQLYFNNIQQQALQQRRAESSNGSVLGNPMQQSPMGSNTASPGASSPQLSQSASVANVGGNASESGHD